MGLLLIPLVRMNRLNKKESAVFLYCRLSLFLGGPFFQIIYRFSVYINIVLIFFPYSGLSGMLCSQRK